MGINDKIKELIDGQKETILQNKAYGDSDILVYDGIVNETCFAKQQTRVLFLLKDGNDPYCYEDGNGYTYRDLYDAAVASTQNNVSNVRFYLMWRNMCVWMRIIEEPHFTLDMCWDKKHGFDVDGMRKYLSHFATVNIKKTAGEGTAKDSALKNAVKHYYELIKKEIELIQPTLVICGGTFDLIKGEYGADIKKLSNDRRYFVYDNCVYLESCHPSARIGYEKHFSCFKETFTALQKSL